MTAENPAYGPISERGLPPLDQHLQSLTINKTRIGKVYDFLLGKFIERLDAEMLSISGHFCCETLEILAATEAYHDLPNRKRLVELIEKAMEGAK